jgi:hypothetical protein
LSFDLPKQFGVGVAAAVLIDATIIRAVLLPASMKLLGDWNWYLPSWLEWLPGVGVATGPESIPEAPPVPAASKMRWAEQMQIEEAALIASALLALVGAG